MKKILAGCFVATSLFSFNALADFETIRVTNFAAEYKAPQGTASADEFLVPLPLDGEEIGGVSMTFFKRNTSYVFHYQGKEFVWQKPPEMLHSVDNFVIDTFTLVSNKDKITASLAKGDLYATEAETHLQNFNADCTETPNSPVTGFEKFIDGCTTNSSVRFEYLNLKDLRALTELGLTQSTTDVTNFNLNVANHYFRLSATIIMDFKASFRADGMAWYLPQEKKIKIRLDNAKAGPLNIKDQIFKSLEDANKPNVIVKRPFIYLVQ